MTLRLEPNKSRKSDLVLIWFLQKCLDFLTLWHLV